MHRIIPPAIESILRMEGSLASPLLQKVERGRESRRKLYGRLCRLGVMLRLLTMLDREPAAAGAALGALGARPAVRTPRTPSG